MSISEQERIELVSSLGYIAAILEKELDPECVVMQNFYKLQSSVIYNKDLLWEINEK